MENIYLLGFMGCGKSTLGKRLASQLSCTFVDMDALIEELQEKKISVIFKENGEEHFRKLEHDVLLQLSKTSNTVVATGGGAPCFFDNMNIINTSGTSIYICMTPGGLFQRLKNARTERPLLANLSDDELLKYITDRLEKRESFYKQAKFSIKGELATPKKLIELLQLK